MLDKKIVKKSYMWSTNGPGAQQQSLILFHAIREIFDFNFRLKLNSSEFVRNMSIINEVHIDNVR